MATKRARLTPTPSVWVDAPDNILLRLAAYLPSTGDRIRMSFANKHWSRALRGEGQGRPPQLPLPPPLLPCLIFPSTDAPTFFCPIDLMSYPLPLPRAVRNARICGSTEGGWLVLALDARHAHALYNIYSGKRIPLPPSLTITEVKIDLPLVLRAATLSYSPSYSSHGGGYMIGAIALVGRRCCPAFWQEGLENWITPDPEDMWTRRRLQDVIYCNGAFNFLTTAESLVTYTPVRAGDNNELSMLRYDYDMVQRQDYADDLLFIGGGHGSMVRYLVPIGGWLHMVVRYIYNDGGTGVLRVFRFELKPPTSYAQSFRGTWVPVEEFQGHMLFVGPACSRSIDVAHFHGFEDSTIYFPDDCFIPDTQQAAVDNRRWYSFDDMGRFSLFDLASIEEYWPPRDRRPERSDNAPCTWWFH